MRTVQSHRAGIQAVEVIVTFVVVGMIFLVVLTALPRQREVSRRMACQRNLSRIGIALVLYDQTKRMLPGVPELTDHRGDQSSGPIPAMLQALRQPDFTTLDAAPDKRLLPRPIPQARDWRIAGLVCPSDRNAMSDHSRPPISYRATTGGSAAGRDGAFAPGRSLSLSQLSGADGAGFTAAFSERLVGDGSPHPNSVNYALVPGDVGDDACPSLDATAWRGDAGLSWATANWVSTLYNHAMTPSASPSCVATDGRTARIGASSGHVQGVHLLLFDLSVRTYGPTVDPKVWRDLASVNGDPASLRP